MPCSEKRARLLLKRKRAVVHRMAPFTIRLKDHWRKESKVQPLRIKIDPGAKITGMVLIREREQEQERRQTPEKKQEPGQARPVIWAAEVHHKTDIKNKLTKRRALRRGRRSRKTRYRQPRFQNRPKKTCRVCGGNTPKRPKSGRADYCRKHQVQRGERTSERHAWLPPSLTARVEQIIQVVRKLQQTVPLMAIRASGYFDLKDHQGRRCCQGISYKYCRVLQRVDGWYYTLELLPPVTGETVHSFPAPVFVKHGDYFD
ncbi:MAG: RRXRR domain-containing protein [Candidatus Hermodarchaeota archaeon]